jgi:hypothetical protein
MRLFDWPHLSMFWDSLKGVARWATIKTSDDCRSSLVVCRATRLLSFWHHVIFELHAQHFFVELAHAGFRHGVDEDDVVR